MGNYLLAEGMEITSAYECGNGTDIRSLGHNRFALEAEQDKGYGDPYNSLSYYFNFSVHNRSSKARKIQIHVGNIVHDLPYLKHIWLKKGEDWLKLPQGNISTDEGARKVILSFSIEPGEKVFVCNAFWYPYSEMKGWLEDVARQNPEGCRLSCIGETAQKREILCLSIGRLTDGGKRVLIAGTPQASEFGDLACKGIIEFLLSAEEFAGSIRERYIIDVIPQQNPDGVALGTCMVNALGQNPLFEFEELSAGREVSLEAEAVWSWIKRTEPSLYLEYHSYFQDNRPSFRPYLFSSEHYTDPQKRVLGERIDQALLRISTGAPMRVGVGHERFRKCLAYQLIKHFDIPSYFYKLHSRETLGRNIEQAVKVLRAVINIYGGRNRSEGPSTI